ncbi:hypothetical protein ACFL0T_08160 [Candidatus Omnitrophota bacterium]
MPDLNYNNMRRYIFLIAAVLLFACNLLLPPALAGKVVVNDGFKTDRQFRSSYFNIYVESDVSMRTLLINLYVPPSITGIVKKSVVLSEESSLPSQLDMLYLAVAELMDIRLKNFKCDIKICSDAARLSAVAKKLYGRHVRTGGFYVAEIDTLYVDAQNVNINVLGHELSHAIQCEYFVVPPPEKIQEILSGYVEYQLRKYTK